MILDFPQSRGPFSPSASTPAPLAISKLKRSSKKATQPPRGKKSPTHPRTKKTAEVSLSTFTEVSRERIEAPSAQKKAIPKGPKTGKRTFIDALADLTMGERGDTSDEAKETISQALVAA